jgi:VWFA-related protein
LRYQAQHRIVLKVVVTDASGKPVSNLKEQDVALLDNGQPQALTSFQAVDDSKLPRRSRLILMLDTVNNPARAIEQDRHEVERYLQASPSFLANPTSIAVLGEAGATIGPSSQDRKTLLEQVRQLKDQLHPVSCQEDPDINHSFLNVWMPNAPATLRSTKVLACLNQRFERSVASLYKLAAQQSTVPGRVLLLWLGPGWPLLNEHEFTQDSAEVRQNFFHYLVELSTTLRESQVTLDAVTSPDFVRKTETRNDHDNAFFDGVPREEDTTAGSLGLEALAHQNGGQTLADSRDLASGITQAIAAENSYYVLSFDSPPAATPAEFHTLRVDTSQPSLKIRTSTLYYAQP